MRGRHLAGRGLRAVGVVLVLALAAAGCSGQPATFRIVGVLQSVAAVSARDAWAVGRAGAPSLAPPRRARPNGEASETGIVDLTVLPALMAEPVVGRKGAEMTATRRTRRAGRNADRHRPGPRAGADGRPAGHRPNTNMPG